MLKPGAQTACVHFWGLNDQMVCRASHCNVIELIRAGSCCAWAFTEVFNNCNVRVVFRNATIISTDAQLDCVQRTVVHWGISEGYRVEVLWVSSLKKKKKNEKERERYWKTGEGRTEELQLGL